MLGASLNKAFYHPNPSLQSPWNCAQLGLFVFPLSPFLGAVGLGFAVLFTWLQQSQTINRRPLNWGLALLSVFLLITAGFAENKIDALLGLFNFLPFFLVFIGLSALIQTPAQLRQMAWILVISSSPIVIMGFGQLFWGWSLNLQFLWIVLEWTIAPTGEPPGRMASILMHANSLAAYLAFIFILALGLWLEQWQSGIGYQLLDIRYWISAISKRQGKIFSHNSPPSSLSPIPFIFLTVAVVANFVALILTNSRNGWAIAIFACLAFTLYQGWRLLVGCVAAMVTGVLLAAFAPNAIAQFFRQFVPYSIWARLNDDMYPDRPVALMRKTQWEFAWSLSQQHPLTGWGLRSFSGLYKAHTQINIGHPHNLFLMLSAETGFPSALLYSGFIGCILIAAVQLLWKSQDIEPKDRLIFFSYLLVLIGWMLFNTVDVTLFDFRLNLFSWWLLAAVCGVSLKLSKIGGSLSKIYSLDG
ncbi:O-antigen ligase family protein [Cylindrospermum sp. FACHB-282]|uniref:O-antigen ligase family protein n=1 Tax=Cylindrospermum sp. FACHB-282 TaxID=2692794 RepID=UPI0016885CA5|nr:O-antigen ligase family protein [Cylindrospermum sp. FACHB-282]MBD2386370.1 O-antigen ligase family protein [Cylindrospermum sp. FACHB-282]